MKEEEKAFFLGGGWEGGGQKRTTHRELTIDIELLYLELPAYFNFLWRKKIYALHNIPSFQKLSKQSLLGSFFIYIFDFLWICKYSNDNWMSIYFP